MNQYKVEKIQNTAQGLCGVAEVLYHNQISKDVGKTYKEYVCLSSPVEAWLHIAMNVLAMEVNGLTEDLHEYEYIKKEV